MVSTDVMRPRAFVWNLLWSVARPLSELRKDAVMYEAEDVVNRRLGERFSIAELAAEVGVSHEHLIRLFRVEHGVTPLAYVRERRVEAARRMLVSSDMPIKEIAHRIGIDDLQQFNKLMRWSIGKSPREIRHDARGL
jgi:transcriptional regulator GlxA family with amidase domain